VYFTPGSAGYYASPRQLFSVAKSKNPSITLEDVRDFLRGEKSYYLHKQPIRRFPRARMMVSGSFLQWQCDLCDFRELRSQNPGVLYALTCIDIFSKFAWVELCANKTSDEVANKFELILKRSPKIPHRVQTDMGKEFLGSSFQKLMQKYGIKFFTAPNPDTKACVVERFNRTLKQKVFRIFTHRGNYKFTDIIQDVVDSYNRSIHRSIGMRPVDVNDETEHQVWMRLNSGYRLSDKIFKFGVGERVRLLKAKDLISKGYYPQYTEEEFEICAREMRDQPIYKVKDINGVEVLSIFYEPELAHVNKPQFS
jgi:hypothetical protein